MALKVTTSNDLSVSVSMLGGTSVAFNTTSTTLSQTVPTIASVEVIKKTISSVIILLEV